MKQIGTGYHSIKDCGVFIEELVTIWLGALVDHSVYEGIVITDFGCGNGRLSHYLSKKLDDFKYFGIEVDSDHGKAMVEFANRHFLDSRTCFGFSNSPLEKKAIQNSDIVIYGSVFTHTTIEETYQILDKYRPVIERGGKLVFSTLLRDQYCIGHINAYYENGHNVIYNTLEQYTDYASKHQLSLVQIAEYNGGPTERHQIFELSEKK